MRRPFILLLFISGIAITGCQTPTNPSPAPHQAGQPTYPMADNLAAGRLEVAHQFKDQYPTGIAVSRTGRMFCCYPRWEDPVKYTVGELTGTDTEKPYPSQEMNNDDGNAEHFLAVQSVVVDPADRLWVVDTGSVDMNPPRSQDYVKLVGIDLATNKVFKTIHFPGDVVLHTTYINDVRFDLRRGAQGTAYLTDSSKNGPGGIIVVDLASGKSIRRISGSDPVSPEKSFMAEMEGKPLMIRQPGQPPKPAMVASDGIAINADGSRLFFCPLTGRMLHSVDAAVLADPSKTDADVLATLKTEKRTFASDGLAADAQGRIYLTDWEHNAVIVRETSGEFRTLVHDSRLWWPDTFAWGADGTLYVTATQLHRQRKYNNGQDLREKPYLMFKIKTNATPIMAPTPK